MEGNNDIFFVTISLPEKTNMNYMFWVPIDNKGDSTDGWDTYGEMTYSSTFDKNRNIHINDDALWMPEKKIGFDILKSGWQFLYALVGLSAVLLIVFRKQLYMKKVHVLTGILLLYVIVIFLIRLQMNHMEKIHHWKIFGAIFPDLLLLLFISIIFYPLIYLLKNYNRLKSLVVVVLILFSLFSILFSLLNIEIVRQLGRPLNYQWLYYSDFMKGTDAKNAIAYNFSSQLKLNMTLILGGILIFGFSYSFLPAPGRNQVKAIFILIGVSLLSLSFYQYKTIRYDKAKTANPVAELVQSVISTQQKPQLFSMKISKKVQQVIESYHSNSVAEKLDTAGLITNVVLFVLESTPKNMVSIYDSTYNVTPNLLKWKSISTAFTNMYSHIPSTSNSMATMISGIYPLISYKSIINEYSKNALPSISSELKNKSWKTSLFSSADLTFGNMEAFAKKYDFTTTGDSKTILCNYPKFQVTNTLLDGLDDKCIAYQYLIWYDTLSNEKKFSILWTNQTHYPYFVHAEKEVKYIKGNIEFNRYLNALKSVDEAFGILMDGLQKRNALNNSLIIVVGDHGEAFGTHDQTGHGNKIYEENVNIPCIIYNPVFCKGTMSDVIAGLIDITPTIVHVLGLTKSGEWEGKSLFSKIANGRTFFISPYSDFLFGTRSGEWKYIYNATVNKEELYNLKTDPYELTDLSKQYKEVAQREYEMLGGWVQFHNKRLKEMKNKND